MKMSEWTYTIDISEAFKKVQNGDIDIGELTKATLTELEKLKPKIKDEYLLERFDEIITYFEDVFTIEIEEPLEFVEFYRQELYDNAMEALYDWGDTILGYNEHMAIKMCWIQT